MNRGPLLLFVVIVVVLAMGFWVWRNLNPDAPLIAPEDRARIAVLPLPTDLALREGSLSLDDGLTVEVVSHAEPRLERAIERMRSRLPGPAAREGSALLTVDVGGPTNDDEPEWIDESYALDISPEGARLRATTPVGAIRALQTFGQLMESDEDGVRVPAARIRDAPRFRWRGLLIDAARHWIPKEVLLRNLDGMEAAKMNVLHLHLTEDQAFRVESLVHPRLHEVGSDGDYFTQDDLREIVAYAYDRGIRVVPEFDLPGHSRSWLEAYPELSIDGGPWKKSKLYGIHPVALDPTRDEVYEFIDAFVGEMAAVFPDPYVHVGSDEAAPDLWDASERLQAYQRDHGLAGHEDLQAHFNRRIHGILAGHGKKMMGWEEMLHEDMPRDTVLQAWLSPATVAEAVGRGHGVVLSAGYYLDHKKHAAFHYGVDPLGIPEPIVIPSDGPWESFEISFDTPAGTFDGVLVVYGEADDLRAVSSVANQAVELRDVRREGSVLRATADSPVGEMDVEARIDGDDLEGEFRSLVVSAAVQGRRTGGHDLPGTFPPDLVKSIEIPHEIRYRVLGGEAAMWSELVTADTIDSRIWPRTGAVAERLWSPAVSTTDVDDMYRRLDVFSERLEGLGLRHESYREQRIVELAGENDPAPLRTLISVLEEVKGYERHRFGGSQGWLTTEVPLDHVADAAAPESRTARRFGAEVDAHLAGDPSRREAIEASLVAWRDQYARLAPIFATSDRVAAVEPLSRALSEASALALERMEAGGSSVDPAETEAVLTALEARPGGVLLAVAPPLRRLIEATPGSPGGF